MFKVSVLNIIHFRIFTENFRNVTGIIDEYCGNESANALRRLASSNTVAETVSESLLNDEMMNDMRMMMRPGSKPCNIFKDV